MGPSPTLQTPDSSAPIRLSTTLNFIDTTPGDPANVTKNATTYFRRSIFLGDPRRLTNPRLQLVRDDAAAIYLNSAEVYRDSSLPAKAAFDVYASSGVAKEDEIVSIPLAPGALQTGENVLAVEVHQSSATSSDIAFDLAVEIHQADTGSSDLALDLQLNGVVTASLRRATIEVQPALDPDTERDGMDDDWELANGLVVGTDDAADDGDLDGEDNLSEFIAGTNPRDPSSLLKLLAVTAVEPGQFDVRFTSVAGRIYQLQFSPNLIDWANLLGSSLAASGPESTLRSTTAPPGFEGFFRVVVRRP